MSSPLATIAAAPLADHELVLFYEADGHHPSNGPQLRLGRFASSDIVWLPKDQVPALTGRYKDDPVWVREKSRNAGSDFHDHVRMLVGGDRDDLLAFWTLDVHAARLLKSADLYEEGTDRSSRVRKRLRLALSNAATKRLAVHGIAAAPLIISVESVTLALFKTSHGFVCVTVRFERSDRAPLTAIEFTEAQVALNRMNRVAWVHANSDVAISDDTFTLGEIIRALAVGRWAETKPTGRVSTYAFVSFAQPIDVGDRDRLAVHLARNYTSDYVVSEERDLVARVADFDTVRHSVALEGAATIIGPTHTHPKLPEFLETFKENTFRQHYVPIALLALHEHAFLVSKTSASVIPKRYIDDAEETTHILGNLIEASLLFRLCFRFSEVSYITMHNLMNRAFRGALRLDQMSRELAADVTDAEIHLRRVNTRKNQLRDEERHRKYYWTSVLGVSALAGLTSYTIVKEAIEVITTEHHKAGGVAGLVVGALVCIATIWVAMLNRPSASGSHEQSEHFTVHAMLEHMIEQANRVR
jgi:hypothetical protein